MTTYTHKLNNNTYSAISTTTNGVLFSVLETGETLELTNNQIKYLLK